MILVQAGAGDTAGAGGEIFFEEVLGVVDGDVLVPDLLLEPLHGAGEEQTDRIVIPRSLRLGICSCFSSLLTTDR